MGLIDKLMPSSGAEEYECNECGNTFSRMTGPSENPPCPECGSLDLDEK
ncbi:MAG: hypothetical protein ABEJ81_06000 [Haloferacaceae archaeon]